ncbi:MAG: FRG domain-containing protein [Chloroflexota bacterium]
MFKIIRPDSWETARALGRYMIYWAFRGQADASWGLDTSLHRGASQFGYPYKLLLRREALILKQFQRRAHHYINDPPKENQWLDWLALIQHYGGPTRLLDFSHSFYVGAFFAIEKASGDAAVWAINLTKLEKAIRSKIGLGARAKDENIFDTNEKLVSIVEDYLHGRKNLNLVFHVEPNRLHERLSIQNGLFIVPGNVTSPFETNLAETFDISIKSFQEQKEETLTTTEPRKLGYLSSEVSIMKIIIPRGSHNTALDDLREMNITSATLFPGLDGFARSLFHHLRLPLDEDFWKQLEAIKGGK